MAQIHVWQNPVAAAAIADGAWHDAAIARQSTAAKSLGRRLHVFC
jgi:hypothetical protein